MAWKDLSIAQRSQLMNIMRHNGISSLSEMRRLYDLSSTSLSSLEENTFNMKPQAPVYVGGGKKFDGGGDKGDDSGGMFNPNINAMYTPPAVNYPQEIFQPIPFSNPDYKILSDGSVAIPGLSNIDATVREGWPMDWGFYNDPRIKFLKRNDTGEFYEYAPERNPNLNLSGYTEVPLSEVRKSYPKRKYIGGEGYGLRVAKMIPGLIDEISARAKSYGINPNLILHRLIKEGYIDQITRQYNDYTPALGPNGQDKFFENPQIWNEPVHGYGSLGLDYVGDELLKGLYSLKDKSATWEDLGELNDNEGGYNRHISHAPQPSNLKSALEMMAASMAYRQRRAMEMFPDAKNHPDWYANAAYNMGLGNKKLANPEFIAKEYKVPDYGVFASGGKIHTNSGSQGRLYGPGGAIGGTNPITTAYRIARNKYLTDYANKGRVVGYPESVGKAFTYAASPYLGLDEWEAPERRALFSKYFGLEGTEYNTSDYLEESKYKPSKSSDKNAKYYTYKNDVYHNFNTHNGLYKLSVGADNDGRAYVSLYDKWDINPFKSILGLGKGTGNALGGTPVEMYDRIYSDEQPELYDMLIKRYRKQNHIDYASGGKIRIKPENRGKFTALKKRTGHSASWFKAHGTPAQKKMAVFELNAKKWKHAHGGIKF